MKVLKEPGALVRLGRGAPSGQYRAGGDDAPLRALSVDFALRMGNRDVRRVLADASDIERYIRDGIARCGELPTS